MIKTETSQRRGKWKKRLGAFLLILFLIALIHIANGLWAAQHIQYLSTEYVSTALTPDLDGYTIAFITDTHSISLEKLEDIARTLNEKELDLLLLGGDYSSSMEELGTEPTMRILSTVSTRDGIYGVEGNHDRHQRAFAIMEEHGIRPLDNDGISLRPGLYLGGVQDLWNRTPDASAALAGATEGDFALLVSHNPDYTMTGACSRANLALSGHTHGGQITFFGVVAPRLLKKPYISQYRQRFMTGWCKGAEDLDVYVSNGTGSAAGIPRIFAMPQVVLITLRSA